MLGFETSDDAAVYRLNDDTAILTTVDFFTPIVDDPYNFGRITAANSLSDIYAMGGRPLTALNLLAFPCSLGAEVVGEVLRGGSEIVNEAGAMIVGGHTIDDSEPKYGLSVLGTVHPDEVIYNRGARAGDVIVLTKALGTGIWGTALKRGDVDENDAHEVIESMAKLNKYAAEAIDGVEVHAGTDITGFGIIGHLQEMAQASSLAARLELESLPVFDRTMEFAEKSIIPGRTYDIIAWAQDYTLADLNSEEYRLWARLICDPQTSGGLMLAMKAEDVKRYKENLLALDPDSVFAVIGSFIEPDAELEAGKIELVF